MQELEKILEEIDAIKTGYDTECASECDLFDWSCGACVGECDEYIKEKAKEIIRKHMNDGWIPVDEQMPEEKINPITSDYYEYQVTARFGGDTDVRHYKFGNGHWWNGPGIVDKYVIAWRPLPEPYRPERSTE